MKIVFLIVVFLHAIIHVAGFAKAFNWAKAGGITQHVSKPMGWLWLLTALLFLVYGWFKWINHQDAWMLGMIAVIFSQLLIFLFWKDARWGTVINVVVLMMSFISMGSYCIYKTFIKHAQQDFRNNNEINTDVLTIADIAHLPPIVQQYLHYTQSVGKPKVKNFKAEFIGNMRGNPEDGWMPFESVQYNFYKNPSRYFYMNATKVGLPSTGLHVYQNEISTFKVKMLNWFSVVDAKGEKMNQAETVTLLNDMCLIAPPTLIDKNILWEVINDTTVKAIYTNGKISVSAQLVFNADGMLLNFISNDRYHTDGKKYENYPWSTPVEGYKIMNGYLLPHKAKLIYTKPDIEFVYGEMQYKCVQYNLSSFDEKDPSHETTHP